MKRSYLPEWTTWSPRSSLLSRLSPPVLPKSPSRNQLLRRNLSKPPLMLFPWQRRLRSRRVIMLPRLLKSSGLESRNTWGKRCLKWLKRTQKIWKTLRTFPSLLKKFINQCWFKKRNLWSTLATSEKSKPRSETLLAPSSLSGLSTFIASSDCNQSVSTWLLW